MALTIERLNGESSFLLTFEPLTGNIWKPFRILLDPVLASTSSSSSSLPSSSAESCSHHSLDSDAQQALVTSLLDIPEPDIVIISQNRRGHCDEATLRQLDATNTKTLILAEPAAAKAIRGWKYFDDNMVVPLDCWENPRRRGRDTACRLTIPPCYFGGDQGEVTVCLIPQKRDPKGFHSAIGITYSPPPSRPSIFRRPVLSPPESPTSPVSDFPPHFPSRPSFHGTDAADLPFPARFAPPSPSDSPSSPRSFSSFSSFRSTMSLNPHARDRSLSVIFSPHGTSYSSLEPYATSHLVAEAALPLTALIHSFNAAPNPWWLGGNVSPGPPIGQETALALGARTWVGTYSSGLDKASSPSVSSSSSSAAAAAGCPALHLRRKQYQASDIRQMMGRADRALKSAGAPRKSSIKPTEILVLENGQELALTSEGLWDMEALAGANDDPGPQNSTGVWYVPLGIVQEE